MKRCGWAEGKDDVYIAYHDTEWAEIVWETISGPCELF